MSHTLHHYTTLERAANILNEGLEPKSSLPKTHRAVSYAFLSPAAIAWPGRSDDTPSINVLKTIIWSSQRRGEEPSGLAHLTFTAPDTTEVYDRRSIHESDDAYLDSKMSLHAYLLWPRHDWPEAAVKRTIAPSDIKIGDILNSHKLKDLFEAYSQDSNPDNLLKERSPFLR